MTSSAPNDLPLCQVTSGRSLTSYSVASLLAFHSRARPGADVRSELTSTSESYRFWMRPWAIGVTPISGLSVSAVPAPTNPARNVPPGTGLPDADGAPPVPGLLEPEPPPHA